jgi:hypothetical protein
MASFGVITKTSAAAAQNVTSGLSLSGIPHANATQGTLQSILGVFFGILGAIAVLMIVIAGFRYIVSAGDAGAAAKARNGVLYACVGLVIAIAAEVIVQFVGQKL